MSMRIAILGATSQIAKDLIFLLSTEVDKQLHLFARRPNNVIEWLNDVGLSNRYLVNDFSIFGKQEFDAIINFVGIANPSQAAAMGAAIFDVTLEYDELALNYVRQHPECRYIFLSSGATYGSSFDTPADAKTEATVAINNLQPQDWYGVAKLHTECRHRSLEYLPIIDVRIFNYFSHTQDMDARFLITDIVRAIRDKTVLKTSANHMVRDYIGPNDFHKLISSILNSPAKNDVVDCYTKQAVDKLSLLNMMEAEFGLCYEVIDDEVGINATGKKPNYFSLNRNARNFGYRPTMTSIDTVIVEAKKYFASIN